MMAETAGGSGRKGMTASEPRGAGSLKVERSGGGSEMILPMNAIVAIHLTLSFGSTARAECAQYLMLSTFALLGVWTGSPCNKFWTRPDDLDGQVSELSIVINHPGSKFPDHVRQDPVMQLLFLLVLSIPSVPFVVVL